MANYGYSIQQPRFPTFMFNSHFGLDVKIRKLYAFFDTGSRYLRNVDFSAKGAYWIGKDVTFDYWPKLWMLAVKIVCLSVPVHSFLIYIDWSPCRRKFWFFFKKIKNIKKNIKAINFVYVEASSSKQILTKYSIFTGFADAYNRDTFQSIDWWR